MAHFDAEGISSRFIKRDPNSVLERLVCMFEKDGIVNERDDYCVTATYNDREYSINISQQTIAVGRMRVQHGSAARIKQESYNSYRKDESKAFERDYETILEYVEKAMVGSDLLYNLQQKKIRLIEGLNKVFKPNRRELAGDTSG